MGGRAHGLIVRAVQQRASMSLSFIRAAFRSSGDTRFPIPLLLPCDLVDLLVALLPPEAVVALVCCCKTLHRRFSSAQTPEAELLSGQLLNTLLCLVSRASAQDTAWSFVRLHASRASTSHDSSDGQHPRTHGTNTCRSKKPQSFLWFSTSPRRCDASMGVGWSSVRMIGVLTTHPSHQRSIGMHSDSSHIEMRFPHLCRPSPQGLARSP